VSLSIKAMRKTQKPWEEFLKWFFAPTEKFVPRRQNEPGATAK
jgi:hypothetical protein